MAGLKTIVEHLQGRVASAIRKTESTPFFSFETVLLFLSFVYGGVMRLRSRLYEAGILPSRSLPCRVISIGNITTGGTGKTPMTILVARLIRELGYRVAVISRGYRGRLETTGGIVSDGETIFLGPDDAGDEPTLMARVLKGIPVLVGRRRYETGRLAINRFNPDVIVLDDAFQHMGLKRDLNLALLDGQMPFGNGHLLPRGLLREPVSALERAHAIVYTRCSQSVDMPLRANPFPRTRPIFHARHAPVIRTPGDGGHPFFSESEGIDSLRNKTVVAFAGLGNNQQFFDSLNRIGCTLSRTFSFEDHHRYSFLETTQIAESARTLQVDAVVTTGKDFVKIADFNSWPCKLIVVDVKIELIKAEDRLRKLLADALIRPGSGKEKITPAG
ncbi:tetraacyldisaccharide 4'-kinase [uncultured Desulfosarcina sp.]|uniref:tetraacyldisaccharide 4'-kinase n=1 Tax=uncultured Desulfosarcina sp. TaxID=218289 RepID=UPI0029C76918|nr:tetraacyldisaccharide 4'-kinase [uncultured Desulfosarcina sp.]